MKQPSPAPPEYAQVAVDVPLRRVFTYRVPKSLLNTIAIGCRVRVPFGKRTMVGFVMELVADTDVPKSSIKEIKENLDGDFPTYTEELLDLLTWTAEYYRCGIGEMAAAAYPFSTRLKPKEIAAVEISSSLQPGSALEAAKTRQQKKVIETLLQEDRACGVTEIAKRAGVTTGVVNGLVERGILQKGSQTIARRPSQLLPTTTSEDMALTAEQERALVEILERVQRVKSAERKSRDTVILIEGITGCGKTEVYLQAIRAIVESGRRALVLLPEISLTPADGGAFRVAVWGCRGGAA